MRQWFHLHVSGPTPRLSNSETFKTFPSGGVAKTTDVMTQGNMKLLGQTKSASGPIGNVVTYTLFDADPRNAGTATQKGMLVAEFANSSHPTAPAGIVSLKISLPDRQNIETKATDANRSWIQGIFDRVQSGLRKSYDLRDASAKLASAHTDLSGLSCAATALPLKAFRAMP